MEMENRAGKGFLSGSTPAKGRLEAKINNTDLTKYPNCDHLSCSDEVIIRKLWSMVLELKNLDATWRGPLFTLPNANEQSLYVLILGHVCTDIFLFHHENHLRLPGPNEDEVEWLVKEVRMTSAFGAALEEDHNCRIDTLDASEKLLSSWESVEELNQELFALRDSICALPQVIGEELEFAQSSETGLDSGEEDVKEFVNPEEPLDREIQEHTLRNILSGLTHRRKERSNAPPVDEELMCYREIRKWVSSTLCFIDAKAAWLASWGDWWGEFERGNDFASLRMQIRKDWDYIFDAGVNLEPFEAPRGHEIAVILYELSEFRSNLSNWRKRFSEISTSRFNREKLINVVSRHADNIDIGGRKRAQVQKEGEAMKKRKHDLNVVDVAGEAGQSCKSAPVNEKSVRNNPIVYLKGILSTIRMIGYPSCSLTARELRLYCHIFEYTRASMWLYLVRETPEERMLRLQLRMEVENPGNKNGDLPVVGSLEQKTREAYLHEIVCMIEEIEPVFCLSHLTPQEFILCNKIHDQISNVLKQSSPYHPKRGIDRSTDTEDPAFMDKMALARRVVKSTWGWEVELASSLEKEIGDTLGLVFTERPPQGTKVTEWLREHMKEAVSDLKDLATKDQEGLELFDRILLSMVEVEELFGKLLRKFEYANISIDHAVNVENQYVSPLMEGWSAFRVLEESRVSEELCPIF